MLRLFRQISLPQMYASWPRTILVVSGIATGVALMVAIEVINATVLANFRSSLERNAGPAALEITLGLGEIGFDESVLAVVRADPDVVAAVPLVRGTIALADDPGEPLTLVGTDLSAESDLRRYHQYSAADEDAVALAVGDPRALLLTTDFAGRHGIRIGDARRFVTARGLGLFTVRNLLTMEGPAAALGGQLAVMDVVAAQTQLDKRGRLDQVDVVLREGASVTAVRDRLAAALPAVLRTARPLQRSAEYDRVLGSFQLMLTAVSLVCVVAGAYLVYNTTSTAAVHRGLVMANLRLFGAAPSRLFGLLMLEALVLGMTGVAAGIPIGIALAHFLVGHVAASMAVIFQLRFPVHDLTLPVASQLVIAAVGLATALVASFFAARRLAGLEPLEVLRTELRSLGAQTSTARLLFWCLALIAVSVVALFAEVQLRSPAWGNFSSTLWYAATVVISVPLVRWLAPFVARALQRGFGAAGTFARREPDARPDPERHDDRRHRARADGRPHLRVADAQLRALDRELLRRRLPDGRSPGERHHDRGGLARNAAARCDRRRGAHGPRHPRGRVHSHPPGSALSRRAHRARRRQRRLE
jgi:putative ABC transport system permease protein